MNIISSLFQIAIISGCLVGMVDTAFAARISVVANVIGQLDTQESFSPGATVVAFVSTPPLTETASRVDSDFTLRARSFSNAAGGFAGIATTGLATSPFVINGNPNNVELPLSFNFSLNGNIELAPTDRIFSEAGGGGGSVSLLGGNSARTSWSGTLSMGTNFSQGVSVITSGDITADPLAIDEVGNTAMGTMNVFFGVSDSLIDSDTLSTTLTTSAVGGNLIVDAVQTLRPTSPLGYYRVSSI